jgi:hypothetical protein
VHTDHRCIGFELNDQEAKVSFANGEGCRNGEAEVVIASLTVSNPLCENTLSSRRRLNT